MPVHRSLVVALVAIAVLVPAATSAAEQVIVYDSGGAPSIFEPGERRHVHVIGADGGDDRDLGPGHDPVWSPGASRIARVRASASGEVITVTDVDGGCSTDVSPARFTITDISWSDDSRHLAYLDTPNGSSGWIHVIDMLTGRDTTISAPDGGDSHPQWRVDGRIAFQPKDNGDLWSMRPDGSDRHVDVPHLGGVRSADWSGNAVVFNAASPRDAGTRIQHLQSTDTTLVTNLDAAAFTSDSRLVGLDDDRLALGSVIERTDPVPVTGAADRPGNPDAIGSIIPGTGSYHLLAGDGGVFAFGEACFFGSTGAMRLNQPVVGGAETPTGNGYWLVASDGGIFSFGDARFYGSTGAMRLNQPIVGMAATATGNGYWLVAADGGIFTFGDAQFHGSTGAIRLNRPMIDIVPTPTERGYRLIAEDGGVFNFGDAGNIGSGVASGYAVPYVDADRWPTGDGIVLLTNDGRVVAFGSARNVGEPSTANGGSFASVGIKTAHHPSCPGGGYWVTGADGRVLALGSVTFQGALTGLPLAQPVIGILSSATRPTASCG
jgi:hypothetical protein